MELWNSFTIHFYASTKTKVQKFSGKPKLCFSSKIKVDTDPCLNQYCAPSFQYVLWTPLACEWPFTKGAPIVLFNLCPTVHWKPLFAYSAMNVSVRVGEYVWSAHSPTIQLKRHDNIHQQAPLENTVMQIASSNIFPASNKEDSPKVSSSRTWEHKEHHSSCFIFHLQWETFHGYFFYNELLTY